MECRNLSLSHLNLMIHISKIHLACQNILLAKTGSKCTVRLPNILFNQMFTSFSCARQNMAEKWKLLLENIYGSAALSQKRDDWLSFVKVSFELWYFLFGTQTMIYQMTTNGVVGGALGWHALLKFQYFFWYFYHIMSDISVMYFWFFRTIFLEYHKL